MKTFRTIALVIFFFLAIGSAVFYWKNLRGIGPAILPAPQNLPAVIERRTPEEPLTANATGLPLRLPTGASISIFAKGLGNPRVMLFDPSGVLLVSISGQGRVVALSDKNSDDIADGEITVAEGLNRPHGLAMRCAEQGSSCKLYVAETDQVAMFDYDEINFKAANKKKIIDLPGGGNHFTRTILFLPWPNSDKLLISVGSTCNVCLEKNWRRAKVLAADADGKNLKVFADGLRNAVFMAIHSVTGKIWVTEMGRDFLGDDLPPDEINILEEGKDYGWPFCYGKKVQDTDFDRSSAAARHCADTVPSHIDLPAHVAPLGLAFIPEEGWPEEYWHNLLVAYHGSWNRSVPTGYKIARFKLDAQGNYLGVEDFISGWLQNGAALGRPVDILVQPGGVLYISDDKAGVVYKVHVQQ